MCGIAGIMTLDGTVPDGPLLDKFISSLRHRGPDGDGRHVAGNVGLIQTRLAIIDLSTGDQPIYAFNKHGDKCALVANGEIYNYLELREGLGRQAFMTQSDCEPPLYLYLRHGLDFVNHLRGMYAIAIHDTAKNQLVLSRDPFGIKPLYYAETQKGFIFASEPQALLATGLVDRSLNEAARAELLQLQFTCGAATALQGISRVLPGETIVVENGRIVSRKRMDALPAGGTENTSVDQALMRLDETLNDTIGIHQRSDVPYGMFLSGGVDSSMVLAMMHRLNSQPVQAFTAGFSGTSAGDERDHARAVANAAGAEHIEINFSDEDFWQLLPEIAKVMDDPAADYAVLPTYLLASKAKQAGLKVILTGEGGDELFGGYARYRRAQRWRILGGRRMRSKGIFHGLGVLRGDVSWRRGMELAEKEATQPGRSRLQSAQAVDCADWLPNDLLTKLDRCLMAFGVEGRVPFLDRHMAEFAYPLPDPLKVKHKHGKWLLRKWLETGMPASKPFSRKRGFTVPVGEWISQKGRVLGELVANQPGIQEACNVDSVPRLFQATDQKAGKAAWTLLFYALWHRAHILGLDPAGDVMETLSDHA
ncbi:MAG: asparagine synthase (glutamine-hydrolyzing) [Rhodospirillaceae bacterium]|jgi:asparagine synthase (glutamine-hydrolysing)|nr:asparagine synthase (glutamine-hydrolyzing) [Rhodospirillales bacterium]MBT3907062.1 asparagine synthase (glutamine-hydrolyzing) [Rhodospirillaceae bacterium]MBT5035078.1 asparagine synthase (glutamine-hydrolyzing) [Rhodospirillaceae bacterium]MBT6222220.1 asparagine synthase (glutamine-hydrolyzing) [Rhodospirillaceae bacterium]MBT6360557.1 asparagine synthase (glutamine-hydrolyzing) [Rhodospirillaceae bacterium]